MNKTVNLDNKTVFYSILFYSKVYIAAFRMPVMMIKISLASSE